MTDKRVISLVNRIKNARINVEREARRLDLLVADLNDIEPAEKRTIDAARATGAILAALELLPS
jgi:hypothetical protein